jgi:hypothetical protein
VSKQDPRSGATTGCRPVTPVPTPDPGAGAASPPQPVPTPADDWPLCLDCRQPVGTARQRQLRRGLNVPQLCDQCESDRFYGGIIDEIRATVAKSDPDNQ